MRPAFTQLERAEIAETMRPVIREEIEAAIAILVYRLARVDKAWDAIRLDYPRPERNRLYPPFPPVPG